MDEYTGFWVNKFGYGSYYGDGFGFGDGEGGSLGGEGGGNGFGGQLGYVHGIPYHFTTGEGDSASPFDHIEG